MRLRRLSKLELENTVADLIGPAALPAVSAIEADTRALGYSTGDERGVTDSYVDRLRTVAGALASEVRKGLTAPAIEKLGTGCLGSDAAARTCATTFLADFGKRAYRRPLADDERTALLAVYDAGRALGTDANTRFASGIEWSARAVLQSPNFFFRTELGAPGASGPTVPLTPFELASALSYSVIGSPPDAALLTAAEMGGLATAEGRVAEAQRLMAARPERFRAQLQRFVAEWLQIDFENPEWAKSTTEYPFFAEAVKAGLRAESDMFLADWAQTPVLTTLLTSSSSFIGPGNAVVHGVAATTSMTKTPLDPTRRAGVLTLPAFLGSHAHADSSSPTLRGATIVKQLLCGELPPVPAVVPPLPPADGTMVKTTRERFQQHVASPVCAGCHEAFDPMGFAFEAYDAVGRFRTEENGTPVDSSGALVGTSAHDGPVTGAVDLVNRLVKAPEVHDCFARQAYRFAMGRRDGDGDECAIAKAASDYKTQGLDARVLFASLVSSPSFATRRLAVAAP